MELKGMIPPWQLDRICSVAAEAQSGTFRAALDTMPASSCLNLAPPAESETDGKLRSSLDADVRLRADDACQPYGWCAIPSCVVEC